MSTETVVSSTNEEKKDDEAIPDTAAKELVEKSASGEETRPSLQQPSTLNYISLREGLNRKESPTSLTPWVALSLTLDGRDKITKVCQYSARLLAWYSATFLGSKEQAMRFKALQATLTRSRKAFRLGRSITEIEKLRAMGFFRFIGTYLKLAKSNDDDKTPAWKLLGTAMKMLGLLGFWAGDNVSFLAGAGLFDNYSLPQEERTSARQALVGKASRLAAKSYFCGSLAGLVTNLRSYLEFRAVTLQAAQERVERASSDEEAEAQCALKKAKEKQFSIFVALLKSCCDVLVFSNNPGVDLHKRYRGKKMHEGFHCLCGLMSASTVLYNSYPNAS